LGVRFIGQFYRNEGCGVVWIFKEVGWGVSLRGRHERNLGVVVRSGDGVGFQSHFFEGVKRIISLKVFNSRCEAKRMHLRRESSFGSSLILLRFWAW